MIILTLTPRSKALLMVSALSCLGGSNKGNTPTNSHGPPGLSFVLSGTVCLATANDLSPRSAYLSIAEWTLFLRSALALHRSRI